MPEWLCFNQLRLRFRTVFHRDQVERELEEELRYHVEQRIEQEIAKGLSPERARYVAVRAMEGIEQKKEECRDMRRLNLIESFVQDLRYALRGLGRSLGSSAVAVLTLALGIGATLAILSLVDSVLLRRLPFPAPDRLVVLFATTPAKSQDSTSYPNILDWKTQSQSFTGVAAYRPDPFSVTGGGTPEPVVGLRASSELFEVLGVSPVIGRAFDKQEQHGKSAVALISYSLWLRRYGGDPAVLGKTIFLNEGSYSVIGVLPQDFQFPSFIDPDVLVPIEESLDRSRGYLFAVARVKPGARMATVQSELDAIAIRLAQAFPYSNRGRGVHAVPLQAAAVGTVRTPLLVLMGAAFCVLLIGCANVGNLVLAKGIARRGELALRSALGAGTGRLMRLLLTESTVLALLAALLGCAFAFWASKLLVVSLSQRFALPAVTFAWTLLPLAVLIAVLSGVLCGLPPALMVWRSRPSKTMRCAVTTPGAATSPISASIATLLPDPDSPTIATISPAATSNETPSTAVTVPPPVRNRVVRSRTRSSGAVNTPLPFSFPDRSRCAHRLALPSPRPRAIRRRSSSPTATTRCKRKGSAARCTAPCREFRASCRG